MVRLDRLLGEVEVLAERGSLADVEVSAVTHRSDDVIPGTLFCCLPGSVTDGHLHAPRAVERGAVALLCSRLLPLDVAQVVVRDPRAAMAPVAAALHGHPSRRLKVAGITGTNGKTTTSLLLRAALEAGGTQAEVVGTLSPLAGRGPAPGPGTTPESPDLQAFLDSAAASGSEAVVLEVSSHALVQHRVDAVWFQVATFTNLSPEHLDFHGTMDRYFAAKAALFEPERTAVGVVNADDPWGRRLLETARIPTRPFSLADAAGLALSPEGASFRWEGSPVRLRLGGAFNVANALAAATAARELGVEPEAVASGLSAATPPAGRFERVGSGQPFGVLVDYAHTPAGLESALLAARQTYPGGRLIVVFGCGGDRDRAKRPQMGAVATRLADLAVLTSDNPRSEDPMEILREVASGASGPGRMKVEPDRRAAIALALGEAAAGDVVVVAGKGHEATQTLRDRVVPFDDRVVAREELEALGW